MKPVGVIGAGFIGTHVARRLLAAGLPVRVITRSALRDGPQADLAAADVRLVDAASRTLLEPALDGVDEVVYCAAGLMPAESNLDPATDVGLAVPPLINVLEALRERPQAKLVFLSSGGTVYGDVTVPLVTESHPTEPITSYGVMKLASEKYVAMYAHHHALRTCVLRCANVYGEGQPPNRSQGVIAAFMDRIGRGVPVTLFGDGGIVRDFVYVDDVAGVVLNALGGPAPAVANVGSGVGASLQELVGLLGEVTGREPVVDRRPDRGFDARRIVLDNSLARDRLGLEPTALRDGLARTWAAAL